MRVAVDANVVAAALLRPEGWSARQFRRVDVRWVAPALLRVELAEHEEALRLKAQCSRPLWRRRRSALLRRLHFVPTSKLVAVAGHPLVRLAARIDPDDAPYLAVLAAGEAALLWTRDRALLQAFPGLAVLAPPSAEDLGP